MQQIDAQNRYIIHNYHRRHAFSSFLPGIAGEFGIPLWVFYTNRGQAIASFGSHDKDNPIVEFQPAIKAYHDIRTVGFRTFIKDLTDGTVCEPFSFSAAADRSEMRIGLADLIVSDLSSELHVSVHYYTLANEPAAGLIRRLTITNTGSHPFRGEILDGLPRVVPYGSGDKALKNMTNTLTAWMGVELVDELVPFFRLNATTEDSTHVAALTCGNFSYAITPAREGQRALRPLVDSELVFEHDTSLSIPYGFAARPLSNLHADTQIMRGRFPCALYGEPVEIAPAESYALVSVYGHVDGVEALRNLLPCVSSIEALDSKEQENDRVIARCLESFRVNTGDSVFDRYFESSFLDNILRGGYPLSLGRHDRNDSVFHIYSRKHGDMERDYNTFALPPEFFSHGFGNYRDVNQNRRCDVFFQPDAGRANIHQMCCLLRTDGFNPLIVHGIDFTATYAALQSALPQQIPELETFLEHPFTPGSLAAFLTRNALCSAAERREIVARVVAESEMEYRAEFDEGYWIDHWTYNLDLIESFLAIFPDRRRALLFDDMSYTYYDNPEVVRPAAERYVEIDGKIRQSGSVGPHPEKQALIDSRSHRPHVMRADHGRGEIYHTNLAEKLLCLLGQKVAALDARARGVQMEAGKPGWYDALNGLPALFGSSMSETCELLRLSQLLLESLRTERIESVALAEELAELLDRLDESIAAFGRTGDHLQFWNARTGLLDRYRSETLLGYSGTRVERDAPEVAGWLRRTIDLLRRAIDAARAETESGLLPTYFRGEVTRWRYRTGDGGTPLVNHEGWKRIEVIDIEYTTLPLFLEGVVKQLKVEPDGARRRALFGAVKRSALYDEKLGMYRVNAPLDSEPIHIGRARSFTPGWLENGSIWLHMEYKFLLELLRGEMVTEFWEEARSALVPFMDPGRYGRSILENSSFIVSSLHPDESLHGRGFVARLSGSTAELVHMVCLMLVGPNPFVVENGALHFRPAPKLPPFLFVTTGDVSFTFLGATTIVYRNPDRGALFGAQRWAAISVVDHDGNRECLSDARSLAGTLAHRLRDRELARIEFSVR